MTHMTIQDIRRKLIHALTQLGRAVVARIPKEWLVLSICAGFSLLMLYTSQLVGYPLIPYFGDSFLARLAPPRVTSDDLLEPVALRPIHLYGESRNYEYQYPSPYAYAVPAPAPPYEDDDEIERISRPTMPDREKFAVADGSAKPADAPSIPAPGDHTDAQPVPKSYEQAMDRYKTDLKSYEQYRARVKEREKERAKKKRSAISAYNEEIKKYDTRAMTYRIFDTFLFTLIVFALLRPIIMFADVYTRPFPPNSEQVVSQNHGLESMVNAMRVRAKRARLSSSIALALILVSLVSGLALFAFAESLALEGVGMRQSALLNSLRQILPRDRPFDDGIPGSRMELSPEAKTVIDSLKEPATTKDTQTQVISILSTKIGSVAMLLFMVQILVAMYRYNVRIASYFDARADALQLVPTLAEADLDKLLARLSPENIEFGRMPKTPTQELADLTEQIRSIVVKGSSKE